MIHQPEKTRICAAICTYDRYDLLENSIASLIGKISMSIDKYNIIIVDNSPAPRAVEHTQCCGEDVQI